MEAAGSSGAGGGVYVVRTVDRWVLTVPGTGEPEFIDVGRVLRIAGAPPALPERTTIWRQLRERLRSGTRGPRSPERPSPDGRSWRVTRTFATRPVDGALLAGVGDRPRRLDPVDLVLIDLADGERQVDALVAGATAAWSEVEPADVEARLSVLVEDGLLEVVAPSAAAPAGGAESTDSVAEWSPGSDGSAVRSTGDRRTPVYAMWHQSSGPLLSLGMLTAFLRTYEHGRLDQVLDIHVPQPAEWILDHLAADPGPAVLLCSNYVWTLDENLEAARRFRQLSPDGVIIHGGPSTPGYEAETAEFFRTHGDLVDIAVHGEGEVTLAALLDALLVDGRAPTDLNEVHGISFRTPSGEVMTTERRERLADLDLLPSPFLTGEFDHVPREAWKWVLAFETNRGCPYGCAFCDWGSATMSRIRKFDLDRVVAEVRWAAERGFDAFDIADANFGILPRDVEIAESIADIKRTYGVPVEVAFTPAKNGRKNLPLILDRFVGAGILPNLSLGIQTTSTSILDDVNRSNISTDGFLQLARELRGRGISVNADLLIGLPGQTYETYRADLQFLFDHEIASRSWPVQLLPNAPMNAPDYRREHGLRTDDRKLVVSSASMDEASFERMLRLRYVDTVSDRMGVLRHPLRYLQWDHGIPATEVMDRIVDVVDDTATDYPAMAWLFTYFDLFAVPPVTWHDFYDEFVRFVADTFGVPVDRRIETVVALQEFLMPAWGRTFPAVMDLSYDYPSYYRDHTAAISEERVSDPRPLGDYGSATFRVEGDPLGLCAEDLRVFGSSRDLVMAGDFVSGRVFELDSELSRSTAEFRRWDDTVQAG